MEEHSLTETRRTWKSSEEQLWPTEERVSATCKKRPEEPGLAEFEPGKSYDSAAMVWSGKTVGYVVWLGPIDLRLLLTSDFTEYFSIRSKTRQRKKHNISHKVA